MDTHAFSRKDVKRFADRILKRLERDGVTTSYPQILEAVAAGFEVRDWNTLSATLRGGAGAPASSCNPETGLVGARYDWLLGTDASFRPVGQTSPFAADGVDLVVSPPGGGKSLLKAISNLDYCLRGGLSEPLPRLGVVEIGSASAGLADLLKELLPADRRHEIACHRLGISGETALNPFDTALGYRSPGDLQRIFLLNLLHAAMMPTSGIEIRSRHLDALFNVLVDISYDDRSDMGETGNPAAYTPGMEPAVDSALAGHPGATAIQSWWQCVDILFDSGDLRNAERAQRHAMPTMWDLIGNLGREAISDKFRHIASEDGEPILDAVRRRLLSAVNGYPNLGRATRLDLSGARVRILDIDAVAPRGRYDGRNTAIAMLIARHAVANGQWCPESGGTAPSQYQNHHLRQNRGPRRVVLDELQRLASAPSALAQIVEDARNCRWYGIGLTLSSQTIVPLKGVIGFANSFWLGRVSDAEQLENIAADCELSGACRRALMNGIRGPSPNEAEFVHRWSRKIDGTRTWNEEVATISLPSRELWALAASAPP